MPNTLSEEKVSNLISTIKKKKELKELSEDFVRRHLFAYLTEEVKVTRALIKNFNPKSSAYKQTIKNVRARLRKLYGLFRVGEGLRERRKLIEELLVKPKDKKIITAILSTHSSTKERLPFYDSLYKKIFKITGKPNSIIDVGCGINPFSLSYMNLKKLTYYAYDISDKDINNLNEYFRIVRKKNKSFKGKAEILDTVHWIKLKKNLRKSDVCFLFKMTDVLDRGKGHKTTEEVVKKVPANNVVVSFPTKTMSRKRMRVPKRKWIELMCRRLGYKYEILEFENEIFYVVKKSS